MTRSMLIYMSNSSPYFLLWSHNKHENITRHSYSKRSDTVMPTKKFYAVVRGGAPAPGIFPSWYRHCPKERIKDNEY